VKVDVIIPLAGDCQHRADALTYVLGLFRAHLPDWGVRLGHGDPDRWRKAEAVAAGLVGSTADVIVVHDGDLWSPGLAVAVAEGLTRRAWAVPHRKVYRLTREATADVLAGSPLSMRPAAAIPGERYERVHDGFLGGGIVALRRDLYDRIPLDPRFVGWGHEDESWAWALRKLSGPAVARRGPALPPVAPAAGAAVVHPRLRRVVGAAPALPPGVRRSGPNAHAAAAR
jgi:hypothetical protein